mgnify:CR=1 FL=1
MRPHLQTRSNFELKEVEQRPVVDEDRRVAVDLPVRDRLPRDAEELRELVLRHPLREPKLRERGAEGLRRLGLGRLGRGPVLEVRGLGVEARARGKEPRDGGEELDEPLELVPARLGAVELPLLDDLLVDAAALPDLEVRDPARHPLAPKMFAERGARAALRKLRDDVRPRRLLPAEDREANPPRAADLREPPRRLVRADFVS